MSIVTVFTCCNKKYEDFIPIFIHSNLYHNRGLLDIEIGVEAVPSQESIQSLIKIQEWYPESKILIRGVDFKSIVLGGKLYNLSPNVVRFYETPVLTNDYVYISDIDIITMTDIVHPHLNKMRETGLGYSNIVRPGSEPKRLTGLHFTKWDSYYPLGSIKESIEASSLHRDEVFLYEMVDKKIGPLREDLDFRPVFGIHCSPNRKDIVGKVSWGVNNWTKEWKVYRDSTEFRELETLFSNRIKENVEKIDLFIKSLESKK